MGVSVNVGYDSISFSYRLQILLEIYVHLSLLSQFYPTENTRKLLVL